MKLLKLLEKILNEVIFFFSSLFPYRLILETLIELNNLNFVNKINTHIKTLLNRKTKYLFSKLIKLIFLSRVINLSRSLKFVEIKIVFFYYFFDKFVLKYLISKFSITKKKIHLTY